MPAAAQAHGTASADKITRVHPATGSARKVMSRPARRLHGLFRFSRDEMRLADYPDEMLEIEVCAGIE